MIINNNLSHEYSFGVVLFSLAHSLTRSLQSFFGYDDDDDRGDGGGGGDGQPVVSNITMKRFKVKRVFYFEWWLKFNVKTDIIGFFLVKM